MSVFGLAPLFLLACTRSSTSDLQPYLVSGVLQEITWSHKGATFLYSPSPPLPLVLWISMRTYFKNLLLYLHFLTLALGTSLYHPSHPDACLLMSCFWWCSPMIISFCSFISKLLSLPCQGLSGLYTSFLSCSVFPPVFFPEVSDSVISMSFHLFPFPLPVSLFMLVVLLG